MMSADGMDGWCLYFRVKSPQRIATIQYVQVQRGMHIPNCVYACMFKIVLLGQKQQGADWFVMEGYVYMFKRVLVSVSVCMCVYESLLVCIRLHPFDFSRVPCAILTEWHGWWWLCCCDLFHTAGCFPRFLHYSSAIYVAVRKGGITHLCFCVTSTHSRLKKNASL